MVDLCGNRHIDMLEQINRRNNTSRIPIPRTAPRRVRRNVGVVNPCMTVNVTAVSNTQKAERIQADEDRRYQEPLRDGFVLRHGQPYSAVY